MLKSNKFFRIIFSGIILLSLFFSYRKIVFAQGPISNPIFCEKGSPQDNQSQIPIGRAIDQAEYLAKEIAKRTDELLAAESAKLSSAEALSELPNECKSERCTPKCNTGSGGVSWKCQNVPCVSTQYGCGLCGGCNDPIMGPNCCCWTGSSCTPGECYAATSEAPCPAAEIAARLNEVLAYGQTVREKYNAITQLNNTMKSEVSGKLSASRLRLSTCILLESDITNIPEEGLKPNNALLSCKLLLQMGLSVHSILDGALKEECYGNIYCHKRTELDNQEVPYPPLPCAEDYFCCYY